MSGTLEVVTIDLDLDICPACMVQSVPRLLKVPEGTYSLAENGHD